MRAAWYAGLAVWLTVSGVGTVSALWLWWQSAKRRKLFLAYDLSLAETMAYLIRVALIRFFAGLSLMLIPAIALGMYNIPSHVRFGDPLRVSMPVGVGVILIYLLLLPSLGLFGLVMYDVRRLKRTRPDRGGK